MRTFHDSYEDNISGAGYGLQNHQTSGNGFGYGLEYGVSLGHGFGAGTPGNISGNGYEYYIVTHSQDYPHPLVQYW